MMNKTLADFQSLVNSFLESEKNTPVAEYIPSMELLDSIDLSLQDNPISDEIHYSLLEELLKKSTKTSSTAFFNQLYGGRNNKAILGELLSVILNNSLYTYKAAGVQVGVEKVTLRKVCDIIGWDENADGTFASGGSLTNLMSMIMARDAVNKDIRFNGVNQTLTVYTSAESHYSIPKNAALTGIGRNNVRYIPVNEVGEMIPAELEKAIVKDLELGYSPALVNATAGTTVLGAFDNVYEIQQICEKHKVWLHVDGAYCGSVIFSDKYKHLLKGLSKVDSFSFNAHKMINTPLTCSLIVVKDKKYMYDSFSNEAEYLFQTEEDELNPGQTSLQCGRRNDALKFWTLWKSVGTKGLEKIVNHEFALADTAREYIRSNPDYTLYSFDDSISVCFNYKGIPAQEICNLLYEKSTLMVSYGKYRDNDFIRFVTINGQNSHEEILDFFKTLEEFADKYFVSHIEDKEIEKLV